MNIYLLGFVVLYILGLLLIVSSGALLIHLPQNPRKETIVYYVYRAGYALSFYTAIAGAIMIIIPKVHTDATSPSVAIGIASVAVSVSVLMLSVFSVEKWVRIQAPGAKFPSFPIQSNAQRSSIVRKLIDRIKDL